MPRFLKRLTSAVRRPATRRQRPRVEALEDRTNPASFNFIPMSVLAVNPQPVPPSALMQFNPLPGLLGLPAAGSTVQIPVQLQGSFQQTFVPPTVGPAYLPGRLSVIYSLQGGVSETVIPPASASQPPTFSATFHLTGKLTEVLTVPGQTNQPPWTITTKFAEQGTVTGPLNAPTAGGAAVDIMSFNATIDLTQTEVRLATATTAGNFPWVIQATLQSSGKFQVNPGPTTTAIPPPTPFTVEDQITEHLTEVSPLGSLPPPGVLISGVFTAAGSATVPSFPPSPVVPPFVAGTTQYEEHLTETVTFLPGPTSSGSSQTLTQLFDTTGFFQNIQLPPGLTVPKDNGDGGPAVSASDETPPSASALV